MNLSSLFQNLLLCFLFFSFSLSAGANITDVVVKPLNRYSNGSGYYYDSIEEAVSAFNQKESEKYAVCVADPASGYCTQVVLKHPYYSKNGATRDGIYANTFFKGDRIISVRATRNNPQVDIDFTSRSVSHAHVCPTDFVLKYQEKNAALTFLMADIASRMV